jgi:SsrA-binding protein
VSGVQSKGIKIVSNNRRAGHDYLLLDKFEAGLVLTGTEIKSVRANRVNLQRSYVENRNGELWLVEAHIAVYDPASRENHDPDRPRKLLLHRREINKIIGQLAEKGLTVVPTKMYLKDGRAKVEVALAKGKKLYDKRAALAKKESSRQIERELKERYR